MNENRRYTEGSVIRLMIDFWPLILAVLGVAACYGSIRNDVAKIPSLEARLTTAEQSQRDLKDDVTEIKQDVKKLLWRSGPRGANARDANSGG